MKKILAVILVLCMMFTSGCSNSRENKKTSLEYFPLVGVAYFDKLLFDISFEGVKVPITIQDEINKEGQRICSYLNDNYELNWKYDEVPGIYVADEITAMYSEKDKKIYLSKSYFRNNGGSILFPKRSILIHEIIHYLMDSNMGTPYIFVEDENGSLGLYFHEAITEYITEKYISDVYDIKTYDDMYGKGMASGYVTIKTYIELTEYAIPDLIKFVLHGNISDLESEMTKIVSERIEGDTIEPFKSWLSMITCAQVCELYYDSVDIENQIAMIEFLSAICPKNQKTHFLVSMNIYMKMMWKKSYSSPEKCVEDLVKKLIEQYGDS